MPAKPQAVCGTTGNNLAEAIFAAAGTCPATTPRFRLRADFDPLERNEFRSTELFSRESFAFSAEHRMARVEMVAVAAETFGEMADKRRTDGRHADWAATLGG